MRVKSLSLKNFRNYEQASITPDSGVTLPLLCALIAAVL